MYYIYIYLCVCVRNNYKGINPGSVYTSLEKPPFNKKSKGPLPIHSNDRYRRGPPSHSVHEYREGCCAIHLPTKE